MLQLAESVGLAYSTSRTLADKQHSQSNAGTAGVSHGADLP
jgi:hypothetical protein